eukprot:scaffold117829_cov47-Phaeocystis_antarctica.AAC.2
MIVVAEPLTDDFAVTDGHVRRCCHRRRRDSSRGRRGGRHTGTRGGCYTGSRCHRRVCGGWLRGRGRARLDGDGRHLLDRNAQRGGGGGGGAEFAGVIKRGLHRGGGGGGGHGDGGGDEHAARGDGDRDERLVDAGGGGDLLLQARGVRVVADAAAGREREHHRLRRRHCSRPWCHRRRRHSSPGRRGRRYTVTRCHRRRRSGSPGRSCSPGRRGGRCQRSRQRPEGRGRGCRGGASLGVLPLDVVEQVAAAGSTAAERREDAELGHVKETHGNRALALKRGQVVRVRRPVLELSVLRGAELGGVHIASDGDLRILRQVVVDERVVERHALLAAAVLERIEVVDVHGEVLNRVLQKMRHGVFSSVLKGGLTGRGGGRLGGRKPSGHDGAAVRSAGRVRGAQGDRCAAVCARGVIVHEEGVGETKLDEVAGLAVRVHLVDGAEHAVHPVHRRVVRRVVLTREELHVDLFAIRRCPDVVDAQRLGSIGVRTESLQIRPFDRACLRVEDLAVREVIVADGEASARRSHNFGMDQCKQERYERATHGGVA